MEPLVSVVIPTHNRLPLLAQTLHTVLAQGIEELEVVVVDEASSDGTSEWLEEIRDHRVRSLRNDEPLGVSGARNAGSELASGRWLAFVDDDDLWLPGKLISQLVAAADQGASWAYGGVLDFMEGPRLLRVTRPGQHEVERLPWVNVVPGGGSNVLLERQLFEAVGGFDTLTPLVEDWDLWIRLASLTSPAVVEDPVLAYRIHAGNASKRLDEMLRGLATIEHRYRELRRGEPLDWDDAYRWLGASALSAGDRSGAIRMAFAALRAGHATALRRTLRALIPISPRRPVAMEGDGGRWRALLIRPPVVPWPPGTESWVRGAVGVGPR